MMKRVTAVITTHKREPEIVQRALESVLMQTYPEMEVIVVDDSPSDYPRRNDVAKLVRSYHKQGVLYIPHQKCQGACVARNTGLAHATGEFIAFLDDDDQWTPEKISLQLEAFTDDTIALVYSGQVVLDESSGNRSVSKTQYHSGQVYEKLIYNNFIGSTSIPLLRTSALRSIGGFDPLMQSSQDYDVWLRLAQAFSVAYVEGALVVYHTHPGERISTNFKKKISGLERINEKNQECLKKDKRARWIRTVKLVPMYAGDGQLGKALRCWVKVVFTCPGQVKTNLRYLVRAFKCYGKRKCSL